MANYEFKYLNPSHPDLVDFETKTPDHTIENFALFERIAVLSAISFTDTIRMFGPRRILEIFDNLIDELVDHFKSENKEGMDTYTNKELIEILKALDKLV